MTQMLQQQDKDFKTATITMLEEVKKNMLTMYEKIENHRRKKERKEANKRKENSNKTDK